MLNKLKNLTSKLVNDIKGADFKDPGVIAAVVAFLSVPVIVGLSAFHLAKHQPNDIRASSVMIVSPNMKHGGTGIILSSSSTQTSILTNDHVCQAISNGGIVRSKAGDFQVVSLIQSEASDLCLVQVLADLGVNTELAQKAPQFYEQAIVSGHPRLMPNVISSGHFSGRKIIEVMTGIRPCTDADFDKGLGLVCLFFNGIPMIKSHESVLVTATIMPGSSGSGVYNDQQELAGVIFAGGSDFGYGWAVPYERVLNFLFVEHQTLKPKKLSQEVSLMEDENSNQIREVLQKCNTATEEVIIKYCNILKRDALWRE